MGVLFLSLAVAWGAAICIYDATSQRIPNVLTLSGIAVTWGLSAVSPWWRFESSIWHFSPGAIAGGCAWWLLIILLGFVGGTRMAAGAGDAKLAASLGTVLLASGTGAVGMLAAVGLSGTLGALTALGTGRRDTVPQGPAMVCATGLVVMCEVGVGAL